MARRNKNIAKKEIFEAFRRFIQNGQTKVTVAAITQATGLSRKTFYNHFSSQDELIAWGFRRDLLDNLLIHWPVEELVGSSTDIYEFEDLPCYSRTPSNALSLDQSQYLRDFYDVFVKYDSYYRTLLRSEFGTTFCYYLEELLRGPFYEDMEYFLNGRIMPEEAKRFTAAFYAVGEIRGLVNTFMGFVENSNVRHIHPVDNLAHEGMLHIVEAYQAEKSMQHFSRRLPSTGGRVGTPSM